MDLPPADAPPLVRRLLEPAAYPHPVHEINLVETHISWVFLTGARAYKVKKPVDLGFLDFTSLERRHAFCLEEVRLNGRFAPELYLGAVPIAGPPEAASIGGAGEPIEWAVNLEQFPERDRLDHVLERGELSPEDRATLAGDVAAVQRDPLVADSAAPWGTAATFRVIVHLNLGQLVEHCPDLADRAQELATWIDGQLARRGERLAARRGAGRVRECHGDLHLANLARHQGRIVAFDGIEFNESLRWIDAANDVAFLAMDLHARGRPELAATVVSAWVEAADDHGALPILPMYLVYRAIVRAAVAAIRAGQTAGSRPTADDDCTRYLALAERLATPARPLLVATCGISGSGKSTLAAAVAAALGAIRLRSDVERKRGAGLAPTDRPADATATALLYSAATTRRTYERRAELSGAALAAGWSVVIDAACLRRERRATIAAVAARGDVELVWLDLDLPAAVAAERVRARGGADPSDATAAVVAAQVASREPIIAAELISATGARARVVPVAATGAFDAATVARVARLARGHE
jgi:aminoglycoside phosphotransferase family enzyme/predicted kinase